MVRVRSRSPTSSQNAVWSSIRRVMAVVTIIVTIGIITFMTFDIDYNVAVTTKNSPSSSSGSSPRIRSSNKNNGVSPSSTSALSFSSVRQGQPSMYYESTNDETCHYYLAESAIPMSGLGLFTTHFIEKGQMSQSMPDICIYVADTPKKDYTHFETHSWSRDTWLGTYEGHNPRAACEGVATLFNTMPPGVQTSKLLMLHPPHRVNDNISRTTDPNAGAMTQYDGISSYASRDIPAGSEITIDYEELRTLSVLLFFVFYCMIRWIASLTQIIHFYFFHF